MLLALRSSLTRVPARFGTRGFASTTENLVLTELDETSGIAKVTLNNGPVNSLSLEMFNALSEAIQKADQSRKIQALILQSAGKSTFSAGLDIREMYNPDPKRLRQFWRAFQQLYLDLYGSRLACIAAMKGHAPAAGCMLALSCDYRILSGGKIGLNESKLGIAAPPWLGRQMVDTIGKRPAELAMSLGTLYSPEEALAIGLVDEVADDVDARALEMAAQFTAIPPHARYASKMLVRQERLDELVRTRDADLEHFVAFVTNDKVQHSIGHYLEALSKKKK